MTRFTDHKVVTKRRMCRYFATEINELQRLNHTLLEIINGKGETICYITKVDPRSPMEGRFEFPDDLFAF